VLRSVNYFKPIPDDQGPIVSVLSSLAGNDWSYLEELCYNPLRIPFSTEVTVL